MINSRRRDGGWSPVTIGIATVILLATILLLYTVSSFRSSSSSSSLSSSLRQAEKDDWSDPDRPTERPFRTRPRRQDTPDVPSSAQVNAQQSSNNELVSSIVSQISAELAPIVNMRSEIASQFRQLQMLVRDIGTNVVTTTTPTPIPSPPRAPSPTPTPVASSGLTPYEARRPDCISSHWSQHGEDFKVAFLSFLSVSPNPNYPPTLSYLITSFPTFIRVIRYSIDSLKIH
jgi:hypothetical protein